MHVLTRKDFMAGLLAGLGSMPLAAKAQPVPGPKIARIIVALADNKNQGIVPTTASLGNGQDPRTNLYWGALYGANSYFKRHKDWVSVPASEPKSPMILETANFQRTGEHRIIAQMEAWDGAYIRQAFQSYYQALTDTNSAADLVAFVGHNAAMDSIIIPPIATENLVSYNQSGNRQAIILACQSLRYFNANIKNIGANPLLMTSGNMAPEAYSLEAALSAWAQGLDDRQIRLAAARSYARFQKLPLKNAKWLFGVK